MPSVLIEAGFLTNDKEGAYLNSGKGQSEMGAAIAEAILNYKTNAISRIAESQVSSMPSAPDPENDLAEANVSEMTENSSEESAVNEINTETNDKIAEKAEELPEIVNEAPTASNDDVKKMLEEAEKQGVESIINNKEEKPVQVETPSAAEEIPAQKTEVVVTEVNEAGRPKIVKEEVKTVTEPEVVVPEPEEAPPAIETGVEEKIVEVPEVKEEPKPTVNIEFRVQLIASGKNLSPGDAVFKGLGEISKEPYKSLFRYMHGSTNDLIKAGLLKKVADAKGFTTSFLVAYKDGVRIDIKIILVFDILFLILLELILKYDIRIFIGHF